MNNILYYLVVGTLKLISFLPLDILYLISDMLYPIVRLVYRRRIVKANLISAFPEKTKEEILEIEKKFYRHFCDLIMEIIKEFSMSKEEMKRRMVFKNLEPIKKGFQEGKSDVFYYLGHFGNWEWMASLPYWNNSWLSAQIYHPLKNKVINRVFLKVRNHFGGECIPMKHVPRILLQKREEGIKVFCGFISDQQPKWENIHYFVSFLNHDTAVFTGGEKIGKKFDAMMYYGRVSQPKRGHYILESIPIAHDSKNVPDFEITQRYMELLEEDIRKHPELWLWTHKRWSRTKEEWERRQSVIDNS